MQIDRLDLRILEALRDDARLSFRTLAKRVGATTPTVAARVRALEAAGVIRGYRAQLAPAEGHHAHVFTLRARPADAPRIAREAQALPGVVEVVSVAGGAILVRAHADDAGTAALIASLSAIPDLLGFDHGRVLDVTPEPVLPIGPAVAVACHTCGGPVSGAGVRRRLGDRLHVFCCRVCAQTMEDRYEQLSGKGSGATPGGRGRGVSRAFERR